MNTKQIESELNNLKQAVPTSCSNIIELGSRYLAASGKMPEKQYCRENVDCNDCPFEISEECTHEIVNKTIDECTIAMMRSTNDALAWMRGQAKEINKDVTDDWTVLELARVIAPTIALNRPTYTKEELGQICLEALEKERERNNGKRHHEEGYRITSVCSCGQCHTATLIASALANKMAKPEALSVDFSPAKEEQERFIAEEVLSGNIVKENYYRGCLTGIKIAEQSIHAAKKETT